MQQKRASLLNHLTGKEKGAPGCRMCSVAED